MRKLLNTLFGLVLFGSIGAAGGYVIYSIVWEKARYAAALDYLAGNQLCVLETAIGYIILTLLFLMTAITRKPKREDTLTFKGEGGTVSINVKAVSDFIAKLGDEFAAVLGLKPDIRPRSGGGMDVDIDVKVRAGTQIPELCRLLQERVRESVHESLGISNVRSVRVNVRDIVGIPEPKRPGGEADIEEGAL
ncbi:MAG: alkaline shock response membrane anchor protein AmaP [Verrucomicrobia bacterium]|nr:alkaline shock response membrane anchor protein AmaP [Verrucomicrobiota bacterium]